ncbi:MAG: hypothetical protein C0459_13845 [Chitinophaga sp.]|jgi:uncharacterized membrane protein (DUF485 family)|nr:hypothetical protein [Chitinophaga sp.]
MNTLKRYLGILWIIIGPLAIYYLIATAQSEILKKPVVDTKIQWGVFIVVFIPIAIGFILFGLYALGGNYDQIPESSSEIKD